MKVQRNQSAVAQLVISSPRLCLVSPSLYNLHWLPICYHIKFKIVLLTSRCLHGLAPSYLIDLISDIKQSRYPLRSDKSTLLVTSSAKTRQTLGDCTFQSVASSFWNALPAPICNSMTMTAFKVALNYLKTHLLSLAFI